MPENLKAVTMLLIHAKKWLEILGFCCVSVDVVKLPFFVSTIVYTYRIGMLTWLVR